MVGAEPSQPPLRSPGTWPKKNQKKLRKKLARRWPFPLDRESERQTGLFGRSKKVKKNKKKACQPFGNLITLPKPNQTNGETND